MRITIVGAGFSGVALANALVRHAAPGTAVHLVGIGQTHGRGVAYGEARPEHLLNVRAHGLGLESAAADDFANWLGLDDDLGNGFLPRPSYGRYLQARLQQLRQPDNGVALHCLPREVVAIDRGRDLHVHLDDGATLISDRVVLAVGALPPAPLAGVGPRLAIHPRYIGWPWQEGAIDRIGREARVLIVGTGLTMADVVATLHGNGHRGSITALSRHGLLPRRHSAEPGPVIELPPTVRHALATHDLRALLRSARDLVPVITDWRDLIDALRPHLQTFWKGLPERERAQFLRHLRSYWEVLRHRVAPQVADRLDQLRASGQLQVRAGRLVRAGRGTDAVEALIRERNGGHLKHERFDVLVRATGLNTDVARTTHPLLAQLYESGLVSANRHALGLEVTEDFQVLDASKLPVRGLYCLGPLLRSRLWEITAVPELRVAAQQLARRLLHPESGCGGIPVEDGIAGVG